KSPPNFHVKSDFHSYQKPVITVMEEEAMSVMTDADNDVLVDFSDTLNNSSGSSLNTNLNVNNSQDSQSQQQQYIQQLLMEIEKLRAELDRVYTQVNEEKTKLKRLFLLFKIFSLFSE